MKTLLDVIDLFDLFDLFGNAFVP